MKILVVDDNPDLLDLTSYALRRERFAVIEASDGTQALQRWKIDRPDLIVLDLGVPRHDGFDVLRRIREKDATPVLVVSGRGHEQDIMQAFTLGADDYVVKPFAPRQLAMRIRAILRRSGVEQLADQNPTLQIADLVIDPETREVAWAGRRVRLTAMEFRIFHILAMHVDRVVTSSRIFAYVWGYDGGDANALRTHVSHLRTKLRLDLHPGAGIVGVPGIGYRFNLTSDGSTPQRPESVAPGTAVRTSLRAG